MSFYSEKETTYFSQPRYDLIKLLPANPNNKILELGSGGGDTLVEIKKRKLASEVAGIELMEIPGSNQSNKLIDKFIITNVEQNTLSLPDAYYDVVLIGDTLEHLENPWQTVTTLSQYLKPGGIFIASVPNIRFYTAMYKIYIKGDFGYKESGLFDKTHLRFFCKKNIVQLFTKPFLKIESIITIESLRDEKPYWSVLNKITLRIFEELLTTQYIVVAKKL